MNTEINNYRKAVKLLGDLAEINLSYQDNHLIDDLLTKISESYLLQVCDMAYIDAENDSEHA